MPVRDLEVIDVRASRTLGALILVGALLTATEVAASATCLVTDKGTGESFRSLQAAIDAARDGDVLEVRGRCMGSTWIGTFDRGKELTIRGIPTTSHPRPALDAQNVARVLTIRGKSRIRIVDLLITGGNAAGSPPTATHLGGGIMLWGGRLTLAGTTSVSGNRALTGAGVYMTDGLLVLTGSASITDNTWYAAPGHSANPGGGISLRQNGTILMKGHSLVARNEAKRGGGGIFIGWHTRLAMRDSAAIHANTARLGGGVWQGEDSQTWLYGSAAVTRNVATERGGGILVFGGALFVCSDLVRISPNQPDDPPETKSCT